MVAPLSSPPEWFTPLLNHLLHQRDLSAAQMTQLLEGFLGDELNDTDRAAALIALRLKGETGDELAAAARVIRSRARSFDPGVPGVLDTCGTGGDGLHTFNISTTTAFVVAALGVPVVKHGNRAVSSSSGSADVLAQLGLAATLDPLQSLRRANLAFCLAPLYHPAVGAKLGPVRRRLGVATLFNALGPLCHPTAAPYQLLGVGRRQWLEPMAQALAQLGVKRAALLHAEDGLDEVSLGAATSVCWVEGTRVTPVRWTPEAFGLPRVPVEQLRVRDAAHSAEVLRGVLAGKAGPPRDIVLANAAAALWVAGRVAFLTEGVQQAAQAIDSGAAAAGLHALIELSKQEAPADAG
ncbi:MAG: anthranilate phosphoribosyltransferase [Gemmataceae bacterium]